MMTAPVSLRDPDQGGDRRTVGHRFGQGVELIAGERLEEGVSRDAALVEADDLGPSGGGDAGELADAAQVIGLVAVAMLELRGGDADVTHGSRAAGRK